MQSFNKEDMDANKFMDWIMSLDPVIIDVDEEGNLGSEGVENLKSRIEEEVKIIREKGNEDDTRMD